MFVCEKCGKEHDGSFGSGRFCSKSCANSRFHSKETKIKISKTLLDGYSVGRIIPQKPQLGKPLSQEHKDKISNSVKTAYKNDSTLRYRVGVVGDKNGSKQEAVREKLSLSAKKSHFWKYKRKHIVEYNNTKFDSMYEVEVAKSLDANGIAWEKPKSFPYVFNDKEHTYTPDFYLPEYDIYLDPKNDFLIESVNPGTGYNDVDKIRTVEKQNNIRVLVLDRNHLDWEEIKNLI